MSLTEDRDVPRLYTHTHTHTQVHHHKVLHEAREMPTADCLETGQSGVLQVCDNKWVGGSLIHAVDRGKLHLTQVILPVALTWAIFSHAAIKNSRGDLLQLCLM